MRNFTRVLGLALLLATAASGAAIGERAMRQVHYVGIHPLPKSEGKGICYIEGPHVHVYAADAVQYRDHDGDFYFVGDPVAYGYEGPRFAYQGHHPIEVNAVVGVGSPDEEWCYLTGPHYHNYAPPEDPSFTLTGGAYFYVGTPPPVYLEARPAMLKINALYTPIVYERPVVEVEAPSAWINVRYPVAVVVVPEPRAVVEVHVPQPRLHVDIGIGFGGGVFVGGGRRHHDDDDDDDGYRGRGRHDNGKHKGHYK